MFTMQLSLFLYLLIGTYMDVKDRKINFLYIIIGVLIAFLTRIILYYLGYGNGMEIIYGMIPGICFFMMHLIAKESVGQADGYIILIVGLLTTLEDVLKIIGFAMIICCFTCIFLLLLKKVKRNTKVPFIPFLLLSQMVVWIGL